MLSRKQFEGTHGPAEIREWHFVLTRGLTHHDLLTTRQILITAAYFYMHHIPLSSDFKRICSHCINRNK